MDTSPYRTTLSDDGWALPKLLLSPEHRVGRPRTQAIRTALAAILYAVRAGHAWRLLSKEWPPSKTVYPHLRVWRLDGMWERIHTVLREAIIVRVGRETQPSAAIIDSPSATTTEQGGPHRFDRGKKINGRKRRLLVDTQGLLLKVVVHPAGVHDRLGAKQVLRGLQREHPRLEHIWADQRYAGALRTWTREQTGIELAVIYPWWRQIKRYFPDMLEPLGVEKGFHVLPRRRIVERTCARLGSYRRLSKDYERLGATTEALIYIAASRLMLRRLIAP